MTLKVVLEAKAVLYHVREKVATLNRENGESAFKYAVDVRNAMQEQTKTGVEKVRSMILDSLRKMKNELHPLDITAQDIFKGQVRNFETNVENVVATLIAANTENLEQALDNAILQAGEEVEVMWKYMEHLYNNYTIYSVQIIQEKVQNMTSQISHWIDLQGKYSTSYQYQRASICYNISLSNVETSKTIKTIVEVMDNLHNATLAINEQATYADADQHTLTIIEESKSSLNEYDRQCHHLLNNILKDDFSFLGSAIHAAVQKTHPYMEKYILQKWKSSILWVNSVFDSNFSVEPMIKPEYSSEICKNVEEILAKLGDVMKMKSILLQDEVKEKKYAEKAKFEELGTLMKSKYQNVTKVTDYLMATSLANIVDHVRQDVKDIIDRKLPSLPTLSIQNYLLTDVCPKSANFKDYAISFIKNAIHGHGENETHHEVPAEDAEATTSGEVQGDHLIHSILNTQLEKEKLQGNPSTNSATSGDVVTANSSPTEITALQMYDPDEAMRQIASDSVKKSLKLGNNN